jgi:predicted Zn-dependent protease
MPNRLIRIVLLLVAVALADCAQNPVSGRSDLVLVSETEEIAIGRREDPKIREQYGVYNNPALQQYVSGIGHGLAKASHRPGIKYHFLVMDSPEVNAFALPGGYIYVTRGLIAYLNSEAELAAVLGHELGHVTARHSVKQITAATAAGVGATVLQIFVPETRGAVGDNAVNVVGSALLSGYGREHELEADRLGAEYLARTGYDPQAMVRVVGVLKDQESLDARIAKAEGREPRRYHGLFASHPDNDTRLQQVVGEAARFKQRSTRTGREAFLRKIDNLVFADSAEQGIVRNNNFYHLGLGLALRFPAGWRVENRPENVRAVSPRGDALIDLRLVGPAKGTPAQVLRRSIGPSEGAPISSTTINGLRAAIVTTTIDGHPTRVACVFLGQSAFLFGAQARSRAAFNQYRGEIEATLRGFHAITSEERAQAKPLRLRVITARAGLTFAELARRSPLDRFAEDQLRVINGMYPSGEPVAGQPLKVVE